MSFRGNGLELLPPDPVGVDVPELTVGIENLRAPENISELGSVESGDILVRGFITPKEETVLDISPLEIVIGVLLLADNKEASELLEALFDNDRCGVPIDAGIEMGTILFKEEVWDVNDIVECECGVVLT